MWTYFKLIEKVRVKIERLCQRLNSTFWGKKAKIKAAMELAKAENELEALCSHLLVKDFYQQYVEVAPAETLKGLIETVLSRGSIFWYFQGLLSGSEVAHFPGRMSDPESVKFFWGSLCKFATEAELKTTKLGKFVQANVGGTKEALKAYFTHPLNNPVSDAPRGTAWLQTRESLTGEQKGCLEALRGYDYRQFCFMRNLMLKWAEICKKDALTYATTER